MFTGRTFSAAEALQLGLISRVGAPGKVLDEARQVAAVLAAKSPALMKQGKAWFNAAIDDGYRQGVAGAMTAMVLSSETPAFGNPASSY